MAQPSPVPAHTIDGFDGAIANAPIACTGIESETGRNVAPLSTDFHTPPEAAPRYQTRASPGTPVIAETRPPSAGPSSWKRNGSGGGGAGRCACPVSRPVRPPGWAMTELDRTASETNAACRTRIALWLHGDSGTNIGDGPSGREGSAFPLTHR